MPFASPRLSLSPATAVTLAGNFTMTVTAHPDEPGEFPEGCQLVVNGLEGISPTAATTTRKQIVATVPNTARVAGAYAVQVRFPDGRVTAPATLTITP